MEWDQGSGDKFSAELLFPIPSTVVQPMAALGIDDYSQKVSTPMQYMKIIS
jgi:hypothetical protein